MNALLFALLAQTPNVDAAGFARLEGTYQGEMDYLNEPDGKRKRMPIDLTITQQPSGGTIWKWKFTYDAPKFSESVERCFVKEGCWKEAQPGEVLNFELKNWEAFAQKKANWFEIQRVIAKAANGKEKQGFRRRYTLKKDELISDKWLQTPGEKWRFSHRMVLRRVAAPKPQ